MKRLGVFLLFIVVMILVSWRILEQDSQEVSETLSQPKASTRVVHIDSPQDPKNNNEGSVDTIKEPSRNQKQFDSYFKALPIMSDLKNLTEDEVHHTPEIIKDGGELIGRIQVEAEQDSTKRSDAMSFFKRCVEDEQVVTAIRAVCLNKIYKLVPEWQLPVPLSDSKISEEVLDLALKLP